MSTQRESLDPARVSRIFSRLAVRYGSVFTAKYAGLEISAVHADWARELGGLSDHALAYGLDHLPPEFPPTCAQFRDACCRAPARNLALAGPVAPPPAEIIEKLRGIGKPKPAAGMTLAQECAARLRARVERGDRLTQAQRDMLAACESADAGAEAVA